LLLKPRIAPQVTRVVGMLSTVDFDNDLLIKANEVRDIRSDRRLPLELGGAKSVRAQKIPKPVFGIGHVFA
jgi:hypothetical protein